MVEPSRAGEGLVGLHLPEGVEGSLVSDVGEGRGGQEAAGWVAGEVEGTGLGYEAVLVVGVSNLRATVDAYAFDAKVVVVAELHLPRDLSRGGRRERQEAVEGVGEGAAGVTHGGEIACIRV